MKQNKIFHSHTKDLPPLTKEESEHNRKINQLPIKEQFLYFWKQPGNYSFKISVFLSIIGILLIIAKIIL